MPFLRTIIFNFFFVLATLFIGGLGLPLAFLNQKYALYFSKLWTSSTLWLLKVICRLNYKVYNQYKIPDSCIITSKHQSAYETFLFWDKFDKPSFILKKELLNIPIFGSYLKRTGMIAIDRKAGHQSITKILKYGEKSFNNKRNLIIFPEGTRTKYGHKTLKYNAGVYAIYNAFNKPVVPIALNTGKYWTNRRFTIYPGTIKVKFLPLIPPGLTKEEFLTKLRDCIEEETAKL